MTPHPTHKGVWSVIGGAAGKLNYLKLRGLKEPGEYRARAAEQAKSKRALEKQQAQRDKELGIAAPKGEKRQQLLDQKREAQQQFIQTVAEKAGWKPADYQFDAEKYQDLSPDAYKKVLKDHQNAVMEKARDYVNLQRESLLADADKRATAISGLSITPVDPTDLTVDDLTRVKASDAGLGISHDYGERAAAKAGDAEKLQEEIQNKFPPPIDDNPEGTEAKKAERDISAKAIQAEIKRITPPPVPQPDPHAADLDIQQTLDLLAAEKALKIKERETSKALKKLAGMEDVKEIQAYNIAAARLPDSDSVIQDLQDLARTEQTAKFLDMAHKAGEGVPPEAALYRHISAGASNALSGVGLTVAGEALVDRSVIDVLGISGAARAMADRLRTSLPPEELEKVKTALEDYHVEHYSTLAREAMDKAQVWLDIAGKTEGLDSVEDGAEIYITESLNAQRIEALAEARKILGTALGEFEMGAALNWAMQEGPTTIPHEVSLGKTSVADAYVRLRAIGLEPGDIDLQDIDGEVFASVTPEGMGRVSSPVDPATLQRQNNAMAIIDGQYDDPDWIPEGFAPRKDLNGIAEVGSVPKLAEPFDASAGIEQGIQDYFGGRIADGDNPRDILADAMNNQWMETYVGDQKEAFLAAMNTLLPPSRTRKAMVDGVEKTVTESVPIETYRQTIEKWGDDFVQRKYGESRQPFDKQDIPVDEVSTEAMHRALSAHPAGYAAFKPLGDLNSRDQQALRAHFQSFVARDQGEADALKKQIKELEAVEPEKESESMFGDIGTNPEWSAWKGKIDRAKQKLGEQSLTWDKYVTVMDGREKAYSALQDMIRSQVVDSFATTYNTLRKDAPLKVGRQNIREHLRHRDALDPAHRAQRLAEESSEAAKMRKRERGKFAEGGITAEREERRVATEGFHQAQVGMFGDDPAEKSAPLGEHERYSLGHVAEQRLAAIASRVGAAFDAKQPVELRATSMAGRYINQQRAIKLIASNKRVALAQGVGSGKTSIGLGAFTHLHAEGKVKRGLFAVPSIVQGQFNSEALRLLDPNKGYQWHARPGSDREERIAALKDPANHFCVMTHQSLRDDIMHLAAQQEQVTTEDMTKKFMGMPTADRVKYMGDLLKKEGIDVQYLNVDEGHNLLNREGKQESIMAAIFDSISANTPYYVNATADPVKNDISEAHDLMKKMNPERYQDRGEFLRRYAPNTQSSKEALRREMLQHLYPGRIDPGVAAKRIEEHIELEPDQKASIARVEEAAAKVRLARMKGTVDVEHAKILSPEAFESADPKDYEKIAGEIAKYIGITKNQSILRAINNHPSSAKVQRVHELIKDRKGKPGVIFAHNLKSVEMLKERLEKEGHRVVVLTGADSSKKKNQIKRAFSPEGDEAPTADILIASDAGAVGMNAQRGEWLIQYDCPETAMVHSQRNGRIHRLGQKNNVELIDMMTNHPTEIAARKRLAEKYELREVMTSPYEGLDDTGLAHFLHRRKIDEQQNDLL